MMMMMMMMIINVIIIINDDNTITQILLVSGVGLLMNITWEEGQPSFT